MVLDIFGLLVFLGVKPYDSKLWWYRALLDHHQHGDFVPLFNTLTQLVWRTCKADVIDQIQIPKQTEYTTWLRLNAIERHYYQKEFESISKTSESDLKKRFPDFESKTIKLSDLTKSETTRFLNPLLQLRQACIHPVVVRNGIINFEKMCVTMEEVLQKLIYSTKQECVEAQRKIVCALNGLAGVYILKKDHLNAVNLYREAIASWTEKDAFQTDSLQVRLMLYDLYYTS